MDEKKLSTILEALADKIDNLELVLSIKDYETKELKVENEQLEKENEALKAEIERYKKVGPIEFKKIERFEK